MRLAAKLSLLLACAVTVPLLLVLAVLLPRQSAALQGQLRELFAQDARSLALECQKTVLDDLDALSLAARTLRLSELDDESRGQALLLLYKETRGADVIGLFDEKGNPVVPSVRFASLTGDAAREHETVSELGMVSYSHHVPLDAALETGLAVGPVYAVADQDGGIVPRVVLAARVPDRSWVLAMELSLRSVWESVVGFKAGETGQAFLVDARNRIIAHSDSVLMRDRTDLSGHPLIAGTRNSELLGAVSAAPLLGWKLVVQQAASEALGPLRGAMRTAAIWVMVALVLAVATGLAAVRVVTRPVQTLHAAARTVADGSLDVSISVRGSDELAALSRTFNAMTAGLRERDEMKLLLALSQSLDVQEVLHRLLDSLARVASFDRAVVLLRHDDSYEMALSRGFVEGEELHPPRLDEDSDRAVRERKPALSDSRRTLVLPLLSREEQVAGLVCLERNQPYTERDARASFTFIEPAAVAVDNARLFSEVKRLATTDPLTGTANRRHFLLVGQRLFETARRYGQPLSALMMDVDRFKQINDRYGHALGDLVLREITERTRSCLRAADVLGRYGGEEFALLLPMTQQLAARNMLAERIRRAVSQHPIDTAVGPIAITVSIGVASLTPQTVSLEQLLMHADARMYEAKDAGRNRVA
ncbi:MAG TPA: diguanylate cyclase [Myxococcales bacterium]|nr:diguanylate cyclase [Myxococcales bacterium]